MTPQLKTIAHLIYNAATPADAQAILIDQVERLMMEVIGKPIRPMFNGKYIKDGEKVIIDLLNNRNDSCQFIQENGKYILQQEQLEKLKLMVGKKCQTK